MSLRAILSEYWFAIQQELFPALKEELGPLGERYERLIAVLEFVRVERQLPYLHGLRGRPQEDRAALARAFIAKAVFNITTTRALIERLTVDRPLRRLCGWSSVREVPSEATFSRAFAAFADSALPSRLHEALLEKTMQDHLVGHISRDSTAIEGREKPAPKPAQPPAPKRKRGRPRKGEQRPAKPPRRLQRQLEIPLPQMAADLPTACDVGTKAQRQRASDIMDRLQAAYRRCRRRDSAQLHSDLGLTARQSGRHSPRCHERATGDQSV